jgi:ribose transport system permease protein
MATTDPEQQVTTSEAAGTAGGLGPRRGSRLSGHAIQNIRQILIVASFVVMVIVFWLAKNDTFLTSQNIQNLINQMPVLTMLALAVTVVLILGEFDLSVPNIAALGTIIMAILATQTSYGIVVALILGGFIVPMLAGSVNGVAVGYGKAPAFVVTLAVGSICAGIELFAQTKISLGQTAIGVSTLPTSIQTLTTTTLGGFQLSVFVLLFVAVVLGIIMVFTPWGRHVQAIGGNETAARLAGVPVRRTKVMAFTLTGLLAGFAGILFLSSNGYFANALPPYLLPAYAAAFFGAAGVGRRGFSIPATIFGALYLAVLSNGLTVLNEPQWVISTVQGVVLFVAVLLARVGGGGR